MKIIQFDYVGWIKMQLNQLTLSLLIFNYYICSALVLPRMLSNFSTDLNISKFTH